MNRFISRLTMLFFFFALILAITSMVISWQTNHLQKNYRNLERQLHQSQSDLRILHAEWSRLNRPDYLKEQAKEYLNLDYITSDHVINAVDQLPEKSQNLPLEEEILDDKNSETPASIEEILNNYLGE